MPGHSQKSEWVWPLFLYKSIIGTQWPCQRKDSWADTNLVTCFPQWSQLQSCVGYIPPAEDGGPHVPITQGGWRYVYGWEGSRVEGWWLLSSVPCAVHHGATQGEIAGWECAMGPWFWVKFVTVSARGLNKKNSSKQQEGCQKDSSRDWLNVIHHHKMSRKSHWLITSKLPLKSKWIKNMDYFFIAETHP